MSLSRFFFLLIFCSLIFFHNQICDSPPLSFHFIALHGLTPIWSIFTASTYTHRVKRRTHKRTEQKKNHKRIVRTTRWKTRKSNTKKSPYSLFIEGFCPFQQHCVSSLDYASWNILNNSIKILWPVCCPYHLFEIEYLFAFWLFACVGLWLSRLSPRIHTDYGWEVARCAIVTRNNQQTMWIYCYLDFWSSVWPKCTGHHWWKHVCVAHTNFRTIRFRSG